ncbi:MAG: thioredoxin family protein [Aureliella sp.]
MLMPLQFHSSRYKPDVSPGFILSALLVLISIPFETSSAQQSRTASVRSTHWPASSSSIRWVKSTQEGAALATKTKKPILLFVRSRNCHHCDRMEANNWANPQIANWVNQYFVPVQLTPERNREEIEQLRIKGYPATFVYSGNLRFLHRIDGYVDSDVLVRSIMEAVNRPHEN